MDNTVLIALISSGVVGSILVFAQFLIQRHDSKNDKNNEVLSAIDGLSIQIRSMYSKIDEVDAKVDERSAVSARVRILRFADEMMQDHKHSKDSYQQALSDVDYYETYCDEHPEFKNNQTTTTVEYIKRNFAERLEKHDFL